MEIFYTSYDGSSGSQKVRLLLAEALRSTYGIPLPKLAKDIFGKPFFPERKDIYFSLSHSKTHLICAVSRHPVGVDIETIRDVHDSVPPRVCSENELRIFDFFSLWVMKESFYKLFGHSDTPFIRLNFDLKDGRIVSPGKGVFTRLYVSDIPGCRAAACSFSDDFPQHLTFIPPENLGGRS